MLLNHSFSVCSVVNTEVLPLTRSRDRPLYGSRSRTAQAFPGLDPRVSLSLCFYLWPTAEAHWTGPNRLQHSNWVSCCCVGVKLLYTESYDPQQRHNSHQALLCCTFYEQSSALLHSDLVNSSNSCDPKPSETHFQIKTFHNTSLDRPKKTSHHHQCINSF